MADFKSSIGKILSGMSPGSEINITFSSGIFTREIRIIKYDGEEFSVQVDLNPPEEMEKEGLIERFYGFLYYKFRGKDCIAYIVNFLDIFQLNFWDVKFKMEGKFEITGEISY
jgi:hypothetical protein